MTATDFVMPKLGLTMTEGTVARWGVTPGSRFEAGDIIVVVETDKIAYDVEAPAPGILHAVLVSEGDAVPVGTPIGRWVKRLLASSLLPQRAGQPVKALVHVSFADLCDLDVDSKLQQAWIGEYRARWAAQRAAASVSTGDGGAWLEGDTARQVACDAMRIPVVTGDLDPGAVEQLIGQCAQYDHLRKQAADSTEGPDRPTGSDQNPAAQYGGQVEQAGRAGQVLAMLEHQILATVLQIVSGPGGVASFLRRNLLGKGLNGPSLPLDVGQP